MTKSVMFRLIDTRRRIEAIQQKRRAAVIRQQLAAMRQTYA